MIDESHATPAAVSLRMQCSLACWALDGSGQNVMAMGVDGFKKHLRLDLYPSHISHAARRTPAALDSCIFADTSLRLVARCLRRLTKTGGSLDVDSNKKKYERLQRITPSHVGKDVSGGVPHDHILHPPEHEAHVRYLHSYLIYSSIVRMAIAEPHVACSPNPDPDVTRDP